MFFFHLIRAEFVKHGRAHIVDRQEGRDGNVRIGQRLEHQRRVQPGQARAAVFLADIEPAKSEFCQLGPDFFRDGAFGFPACCVWGDVFLAKCLGHIINGRLFFGQSEIHWRASESRIEHLFSLCPHRSRKASALLTDRDEMRRPDAGSRPEEHQPCLVRLQSPRHRWRVGPRLNYLLSQG